MRGVARMVFLGDCRRNRRWPEGMNEAVLEEAEVVWRNEYLRSGDGTETVEALRLCVGGLAEEQRRVVRMHYEERLGREAMAAQLGLSEDGVKTLLRRVRAKLAECVARRVGGRAEVRL